MMQRVFVALLTVAVFAAGYAVRLWTEREHPVPPPPAALANEFAPAPQPVANKEKRDLDRAKLVQEIEKLRPQIEAYRGQVDEIFAEFDREFVQILNSKQREKFVANQKHMAESRAKAAAERKPLTDEDIYRARERPLTELYWMVTITPRLERLTREYDLDPAQQASARALLSLRKNKFLALLDATPHPSIRLSKLAPLIERVCAPSKDE